MAQEFQGPVVVYGDFEVQAHNPGGGLVRVPKVKLRGNVQMYGGAVHIDAKYTGGVTVEGTINASVGGNSVAINAVSLANEAIHAHSNSRTHAALAAYNVNPEGGSAVFAKKDGPNGHAGFFVGNVWIEGKLGVKIDIELANGDCAEDFDIANAELIEPGTVMVLSADGTLVPSQAAYDKRVVGVVSGAGNYKPGIVFDRPQSLPHRKPIALLGKVYCKIDASHAPVEIGDLLTTSPTCGHAMKASDPEKAFGAVIGKALHPLPGGQGLIPIVVALQ